MRTHRNPAGVHPPLAAYSHQIELDATERLLILSGQIGMRPDGSVPDDPLEQMRIALDNVRRNLEAAHMGVADIVKVTIYLTQSVDADQRRALLQTFFGASQPCMTLLYVTALAASTLKVEIDVMASTQ